MLNRLRGILCQSLPKEVSERWRLPTTMFVLVFSLGFSMNTMAFFYCVSYLGPGLGEQPSLHLLRQVLLDAQTLHPALYYPCAAFLGFTALWLAGGTWWGYARYKRQFGQDFPLYTFWHMLLVNGVCALSISAIMAFIGLGAWVLGWDFKQGFDLVVNGARAVQRWVDVHVPTIVALPNWLAFIVMWTVVGFFHYWLHRLGHQFRLGWLLFHRHHHMSPVLIHPTTLPVFVAVPLFLVIFVPYTFIFGALGKLFSPQPLYTEIILYNCLVWIPGLFGHQTALYDVAQRSKIIRFLGYLTGGSTYHYTHHASSGLYERYGSNIVNLGGSAGGFFMMWDHIFGTFASPPDQCPPVGLMGQPQLHGNPIRVAYSGMLQLAYEWRHNRSWRERLKIIFGRSDYVPPLSKDYALA